MSAEVPSKHRKKRKREDEAIEAKSKKPKELAGTGTDRKERRKKRDSEINPHGELLGGMTLTTEGVIYPDPSVDVTLSEQSQKALGYVYVHVTSPSNWKFNKARQNWLSRNLWDQSLVPDKYFPMVITYLKDIKGAAREHLVKACQVTFNPVSAAAAEETIPESMKETAQKVKEIRANALLKSLDSSLV